PLVQNPAVQTPGMSGRPVEPSTAVLLWNPRMLASMSATGNGSSARSMKFDSLRWTIGSDTPTSSPLGPLVPIDRSLSLSGPKVRCESAALVLGPAIVVGVGVR